MQGGVVLHRGRKALRRRSSLEQLDSKPGDYISSKDDYEEKEHTKHVAELLEITGASNINNAVKLQVDILKAQKMSQVSSLISVAKRAADLEDQKETGAENSATKNGLAAALAASKLKSRAAKVVA